MAKRVKKRRIVLWVSEELFERFSEEELIEALQNLFNGLYKAALFIEKHRDKLSKEETLMIAYKMLGDALRIPVKFPIELLTKLKKYIRFRDEKEEEIGIV